MLLIKRTSAWDELSNLVEIAEKDGIESPLTKLYDVIEDFGKRDALDNVVVEEFPNGVEIDELEDFFKDEQDFIFDRLGISDYDDADEETDDEDEDLED